MKKSFYFRSIIICSIFGFLAVYSVAYLATTASVPGVFSVSGDDLKTAGFTAVKGQAVVGAEFQLPVKYFRVGETVVKTHPEWGDTSNLVSVFIMTRHDPWIYEGGKMETINLAGRIQIRVSKLGYYITVTGPDAKKVTALANILVKK